LSQPLSLSPHQGLVRKTQERRSGEISAQTLENPDPKAETFAGGSRCRGDKIAIGASLKGFQKFGLMGVKPFVAHRRFVHLDELSHVFAKLAVLEGNMVREGRNNPRGLRMEYVVKLLERVTGDFANRVNRLPPTPAKFWLATCFFI
jgi:hypothetical protein